VIKEENNQQIVPVNQDDVAQEVVEEIYDIDCLLEVKNWAMQSTKWRLLVVFIHTLTIDQFSYKCSNGKTIIEHLALMMRLALTNSRKPEEEKSAMTMVKTFIHSVLFKEFFNRSSKNLSPELTLLYFDIIF
jgi:hypothetical protein